MYIYKLLTASSAVNLEFVSGKNQGRKKAYESSQPLNGSATSYDPAMKIRSEIFRGWEEQEGERREELHKCGRLVANRLLQSGSG